MKHLSKQQILLLHKQLLEETGGADGVRDEGLLESAPSSPYSEFAGQEFYPSVESKAARLANLDWRRTIHSLMATKEPAC
jgi:death-on-curing protein